MTTAASATAVNTLNFTFRVFSLISWYPTNALRSEIRVFCLNTAQATKRLISVPLPFRNQSTIRNTLFQAPIVEFTGDGFAGVKEVVNVTGALMMDLKDGPTGFYYPFIFMRLIFS